MELTLDQALQKGVEAHKAGKAQEADQYYTAILKANPKHPDANHNMGVLAVGVGKVEAALPFFKTAIGANPNIAQFWLSYIDALIKLDRMADAKAVLDQAKSKGANGEGFDHLEKQLGAFPSKNSNTQEPPEDQLQNLINLYTQGQYQEALTQASKLLKDFPNSVNLYNISGAVNKGLGRLETAITAYKKAIALNSNYVEAYNNLGNALKDLGKMDEAIEAFRKAIALKPDYAEAHKNMGIALNNQGIQDEAIAAFNNALSIKPDYAEAYLNMGNAFKDQAKLSDAIEAYNNALSIKPDYAEAYLNMGNAFKDQAKLSDAIEAYNKALSIKPDYAEAFNNVGTARKDQGRLDEAIEAFNKALSIRPNYVEALNNIGNVFQDQGKGQKAIEAYSKVLSIKPNYIRAASNLAILFFGSGKFEEAAKLFSMDDSINSQSWLLKCLYELDKKSKFYKQLDYLIERGENNCVIGSYTSRAKIRYGANRENPFCNEPMKYVRKIDLSNKCDFKKIFVENATNVLNNDEISHKSQGHLTNGIQTSGNIFTQIGSVANLWQEIIRSELTSYKEFFCDSDEGLIRAWPSDYSIYGWLVSMKNGGELSAHIHDTGWITGSIYINVPPKSQKDSGNLVVTDHDPKDGKGNAKDIKSIDVVTGSLCLFPSSLLHYTIPFESENDRIVLAFDVIPNR